jgi:sodium-coupled neutral amino acid transporter 9
MFASDNILAFIIRAVLLTQMMTVYPMLMYLVRAQLFGFWYGTDYPSKKHVMIYSLSIPALTTLVASVFPNVGIITSVLGAVCGLYFIYLVPPLIHIRTLRRKHVGLTESIVLKSPEELVGSGSGKVSIILHSCIPVIGFAILVFQFVKIS